MRSGAPMTRQSWLLFAAMCVIWGIPYLLIRVAVRELSPALLVLGRTGIAALLLLPVAAVRGEIRPALRAWRPVLAFAGIEIAVPWVFLADSETRLSSSLVGLLIAGVPLVGALIARTTGTRERLGATSAVGLLLGVAGVAALVGLNATGASASAVGEVGVVVVCYALGPAILTRWLSDVPALGVIAVSLAVSAVVYVPFAAGDVPSSVPSGRVIASVLGLAVVCTALAFIVFFALIDRIGPVRSTVITYVNPAVAAALGVTVLNESFTVAMGVGFALVLAGSVLATRPARRTDPVPDPLRA
jgi:drug/metabolite transporter (DMT)-like permease